ncbi:probable assembly chaperone of rpl4 [Sinocyclocheilus rhinocerous]|uniref:probable assembly chaperone of rpl4 n=1 Tax=Sinocyclocheilus rhinocerous TaxID=307959 RepID=UPI0007B8E0F2|nr:PREDICTED: probable assembly chaperone of rpl4 [Sinocyclocheilus rhinocerous]
MGGQAKSKKKNKAKRKDTKPTGGALMSPQERMKAKMQERAKKKTAGKYTTDQLIEKTEECIDNFDFDMARLYCQRALDIEPTNLTLLDMMGNICTELGDIEKAKQVYLKAVELSPEEGHSKYMYLGQIHTGIEAVQYFSKGTEVMLNVMDKHTNEASAFGAAALPSVCAVSKKDMSVAFCSIAEIFFTDLCMEEGAADCCKEAIDKALQYDEHNPEALQLMASYLFSIEKTESNIPPYESRITTAKLLIEAEECESSPEFLSSPQPRNSFTLRPTGRSTLKPAGCSTVKPCDASSNLLNLKPKEKHEEETVFNPDPLS